ncbi:hypothetical protein H1R20_g14693, partial [Candolleomyces eurysporus]
MLHFDLRVAGFADIESLRIQKEGNFEELARKGGWYEEDSTEPVKLSDSEIQADGWDTFEAEALAFKDESINIQRRAQLFVTLPKVFVPGSSSSKAEHRRQASEDTAVAGSGSQLGSSRKRWFLSSRRHERYVSPQPERDKPDNVIEEERKKKRVKRVSVLFFDEAHKLPHLIPSSQTMQTLLDPTLVLTKQDRLCPVAHATSNPIGAAGFRMYQATSANGTQQSLHHAAMMHMGMGITVSPPIASFTPYEGVGTAPEFSPMQPCRGLRVVV